jgi:hypothetical protein
MVPRLLQFATHVSGEHEFFPCWASAGEVPMAVDATSENTATMAANRNMRIPQTEC